MQWRFSARGEVQRVCLRISTSWSRRLCPACSRLACRTPIWSWYHRCTSSRACQAGGRPSRLYCLDQRCSSRSSLRHRSEGDSCIPGRTGSLYLCHCRQASFSRPPIFCYCRWWQTDEAAAGKGSTIVERLCASPLKEHCQRGGHGTTLQYDRCVGQERRWLRVAWSCSPCEAAGNVRP